MINKLVRYKLSGIDFEGAELERKRSINYFEILYWFQNKKELFNADDFDLSKVQIKTDTVSLPIGGSIGTDKELGYIESGFLVHGYHFGSITTFYKDQIEYLENRIRYIEENIIRYSDKKTLFCLVEMGCIKKFFDDLEVVA